MKKKLFSSTIAAMCAVSLASVPLSSHGAEDYFTNWPEGTSPRFIGTKLAERFLGDLKRKPTGGIKREIRYQEIITWYGSLTFADVSKQENLKAELIGRMEPLMKGETHVIPPPDHVDRNVLGSLAAEVFMHSRDKGHLEMAKHFADVQWEPTKEIVEKGDHGGKPQEGLGWKFDADAKRFMEEGLSWQTRFWIDDMYMVTMAQGQMFRASGERKYVDRAAKEMVAYLDKLQEPNGLFYHAPDVPFFWGRGNGWMAAGMTELLRILPEDNADRPRILDGYKKMMVALKDSQTEDGMWRQLVDDSKSWPETSCTGMFTFALVTGVKEGWLDREVYGPVARKGWIALAGFVHGNGAVCQVCDGTDKKNSHEYYMKRPRILGDLHGQAAVLWSATALMRD